MFILKLALTTISGITLIFFFCSLVYVVGIALDCLWSKLGEKAQALLPLLGIFLFLGTGVGWAGYNITKYLWR